MKARKTLQHSGDALTLTAGVDHQQYRGAQQFGDVGGGAACRGDGLHVDPAVEKAHHPFDHGDVGTVAAVPVQRTDQLLGNQHRVQVASGPAGRQAVIAGVDEVGSDLERRDPATRGAQRTDQTRCYGGLSAARGGCGDDDGRDAHHAHHSMPR
jgi:hypothetical protein